MIALVWLLVASLGAQEKVAPLVDVPEGWKHERFELPPSFAPELVERGIEDLSFAPGMFKPESPSYFSYALALRFDGELVIDERFLARFLELYYRGLYHAVAEGKTFANDESKVSAKVERVDGGFVGRVSTFDPFTDGRALSLTIELALHESPGTTEVLGLASPQASDAPVWKELRALATAWRAKRPTSVGLNHVYAVVDRATYDALVHSSYLRDTFAVSEERTTTRADVSYSGFYLYGRNTYVEFLPEGAAGLALGSTGLAFGVDAKGELDAFAQRLAEQKVATQGGPRTRELDGKAVPWFQILGLEVPGAALSVFGMEYDPKFLAGWHAELAPVGTRVDRNAILERYAAALKRSELRDAALFADVRALTLDADEAQLASWRSIAAAARFTIETTSSSTECVGARLKLTLKPAKTAGGITSLELALRRKVEHAPLVLGQATLEFSGDTATLRLRR